MSGRIIRRARTKYLTELTIVALGRLTENLTDPIELDGRGLDQILNV